MNPFVLDGCLNDPDVCPVQGFRRNSAGCLILRAVFARRAGAPKKRRARPKATPFNIPNLPYKNTSHRPALTTVTISGVFPSELSRIGSAAARFIALARSTSRTMLPPSAPFTVTVARSGTEATVIV